MPPKKPSRSAVWYFVKEKIAKKEATGNFNEALNLVHGEWKNMSKAEREPYEKMFKDYKASLKQEKNDAIPGNKQEYLTEISDINSRTTQITNDIANFLSKLKSLSRDDSLELIKKQKWYIVKFQTFCKCEEKPDEFISYSSRFYYVMAEVGAIEYSLKDGITNEFHAFISPNKIPLGYRSQCMESSRDLHKIPLDKFAEVKYSYQQIYQQLEQFLRPKSDNNNYVPVFTMGKDVDETMFGLEFLEDQSRLENARPLFAKVYDLECLVMQLAKACNINVTYNSAHELLSSYSFDYSSNTRCGFHEEEGVIHCAFAKAKKLAYLLSDELCPSYGIQVTESHLPTEKPVGTVVYSNKFNTNDQRGKKYFNDLRKRPHENDEIYETERNRYERGSSTMASNSTGRSNMIATDIRYQQQQQRPPHSQPVNRSNSNRRLIALENANSDSEAQSNVSGRYDDDDDDDGFTAVNKNKIEDDNKSVVSSVQGSSISDSSYRTLPTTRFMGRGRAMFRNN
ncbi:unnamed protein product [Brachionus calyciflorus]|uniref:Maelstrom n=1 Tax=Brachionus calyciflorus TaxID=104777 RepID=A0A813M5Q2_9BILA|nr:unnamed protein product [Brachionus calyciflorus]